MKKTTLMSVAVLLSFLYSSSAFALELNGSVIDGFTGAPLEGVLVKVEETGATAFSDTNGEFIFKLSGGSYTLHITAAGYQETAYVNQRAGDFNGVIKLIPINPPPEATPIPFAMGFPYGSAYNLPGAPISISEFMVSRKSSAPLLPAYSRGEGPLPKKIRVGRRFSSTCAGVSVQRIDELDLEDYVKGVVPSEIGVFRSAKANPPIENPQGAGESFKLFAVAARSYAFWFYLKNPDAEYHLDDTACNQRYEDSRIAEISKAVDETAGEIFVKASNHDIVDKYEYAASDGRTGCRPWGTQDIIPDDPPARACVGTWCGHDSCAAHEDNPLVPGQDRCLVRGICQWGSAERSLLGHSYKQMAKYYQPNLDIIKVGEDPPVTDAGTQDTGFDTGEEDSGEDSGIDAGSDAGQTDASPPDAELDESGIQDIDAAQPWEGTDIAGYIREGDAQSGKDIEGAKVILVRKGKILGGQTTDEHGFFQFKGVQPGVCLLTVEKQGYYAKTLETEVEEGVVNWLAIALESLIPSEDAGGGDSEDGGIESDDDDNDAASDLDGGKIPSPEDGGGGADKPTDKDADDSGGLPTDDNDEEEDDDDMPTFDSYFVGDGCSCRAR